MRVINDKQLKKAVFNACIEANIKLRPDVQKALQRALRIENKSLGKDALKAILYNSLISEEKRLAICQDTGMPVVFLDIGQDACIKADVKSVVNEAVEDAYICGSFRNSIVVDPLLRGRSGYSPSIIHIDCIKGNKIRITVLPKGFGCENKTQLKMFKPTASIDEIKKFLIDVVRSAGPDACPPYVVGVGIGGTADYACLLAKKALLRKITHYALRTTHYAARLEKELLKEINKLNIGPMGFGGKTTALAVNIETYPTHIAGLPVAVNISCHALRSATVII